jgi:hypothetical protein
MAGSLASPDPVREAKAYQQSLLDALGADDPADAQASTPSRIRRLVEAAGGDLRTRPAAGEWWSSSASGTWSTPSS